MFANLLQPSHLLVILILCILIFGPKRLPAFGKSLGEGLRGLRGGLKPNSPAKSEDTKTKESTESQPVK
jgi:sec-independent protein translocase protein TatA